MFIDEYIKGSPKYEKLKELLEDEKNKFQIVLAIGQINSFAFKVLNDRNIDEKLLKKSIGEIYVTIIEQLFPVIAFTIQKKEDKVFYEPLINLYFQWKS